MDHKLADFDLVHNFGSINRDFWFAVKGAGVPLVVTPILWPKRTFFSRLCASFACLSRDSSPYTKNPMKVYYEFRLPDRLIVNSYLEAARIRKMFALPSEPFVVVPNGVDKCFADADRKLFIDRYQTEDFLLCVGRITSVKNQLNLIRAARGLNQKLVFIGSPEPSNKSYYDQCRSEAEPNTLFIDRVDQGAPVLASAYAAAKLVVIPSRFETCGIVAMESALAGTPVAITKNGGTSEYYRDYVNYLDPQSVATLRKTLVSALETGKDVPTFREFVEKNYLWECVIDRTIDTYRQLLNRESEEYLPAYVDKNASPLMGDRL